jgi:hypothetical protein
VGPLAILFDLDDTLLANPMDTFVPAYFRALTSFMADELPPRLLIDQLLHATRAMDSNDDPARTNEQAFADAFFPGLGRDRPPGAPLSWRSGRPVVHEGEGEGGQAKLDETDEEEGQPPGFGAGADGHDPEAGHEAHQDQDRNETIGSDHRRSFPPKTDSVPESPATRSTLNLCLVFCLEKLLVRSPSVVSTILPTTLSGSLATVSPKGTLPNISGLTTLYHCLAFLLSAFLCDLLANKHPPR